MPVIAEQLPQSGIPNKRIHTATLGGLVGEQLLSMPLGFDLLTAYLGADDDIAICYKADPAAPNATERFLVAQEGDSVPANAKHVASVPAPASAGQWHIFLIVS